MSDNVNVADVIDLTKTEIKVKYCIDDDTRDRQIAHNLARNLPGLTEVGTVTQEKCAIVCFGPSLQETWEDVYKYKTIYTCSGSHKFLLDKGVDPERFENWYHVECDPREHKCLLLGKPHPKVQYLFASVCHPALYDLCKEHSIKVWHSYDNTAIRDAPTIYPRGHLIFTGGSNVGLRAIVIARVMGFVNQEIYGMDYSFPAPEEGKGIATHAAFHPNSSKTKKVVAVELEGVYHSTTQTMVHYAREFWEEMKALPDVHVNLNGRGLLQHWAHLRRNEMIECSKQSMIAAQLPITISDKYRELNSQLHRENMLYGSYGHAYAKIVTRLREKIKAESVLDYGCGKGTLAAHLPFPIWEYDPAIPGKDRAPRSADLVVCIDVLEHVEPDYIDSTLGDLQRVVKKIGFFVIDTKEASKTLPDGRNTHVLLRNKEWWREKLANYFHLADNAIIEKGRALHVIVTPDRRLWKAGKHYTENRQGSKDSVGSHADNTAGAEVGKDRVEQQV